MAKLIEIETHVFYEIHHDGVGQIIWMVERSTQPTELMVNRRCVYSSTQTDGRDSIYAVLNIWDTLLLEGHCIR